MPALLVLLGLAPAFFGTVRLLQLARGGDVTPGNARFFAQPLPITLHVLSVVPFSLLGAFQFAAGFRRRRRNWHRAAGRILAPLGLVAALTGLWMAHFYPWPPEDGVAVYVERLVVGVAMTGAILMALVAVRQRDFPTHGAWMIRAYALGMGAGTQVLTHLPWFVLMGAPGKTSRAFLMGAGWAINAVVAEWIIRGEHRRQRNLLQGAAFGTLADGRSSRLRRGRVA